MNRLLLIFLLFLSPILNAQIIINEFSAHKGVLDENGEETDWIEIINSSNQAENLSNYFLTDDLNELEKWQLPELFLMPNEMILFYSSSKNTQFYDGENNYFHTNFKLSPNEHIALFNGDEIIDSIAIDSNLYFGISIGKYPDGSNQWCYFDNLTPNESNSQSLCYQGITSEPIINLESGWYSESQNINLTDNPTAAEIHFSVDGSIPTDEHPIFDQSLIINSNTSFSVRAFLSNFLPSRVIDRTYIFEEDNHNLSVFSIHTNPENLWDEDNGIYVSGPNASDEYPYFGSNFWEPWSKYSRLEYFDREKNKKAEEILDLEIHGGWSRAEPQKSFRIDFKSKYSGRLEEAIIPSKSYIGSYNNINLRNGGQHTWSDKIQDALISKIASETKVNHMAYEPCIVYLNGEYWGVYGIREKIDEHYIEDNFGYNSDSVDLMNAWNVLAGSNQNANETFNLLMGEDANSPIFYSLFSSSFNIENYIDYFIIQTFIQNMDWMGIAWQANNIKLWRPQEQDGKWSYVLYDTDGALGYFGQNYWENYLAYAMNPGYPNQHSQLFNKVLQNDQFRCQFTNRYADLINTTLKAENFEQKANLIKNDMLAAMPDHIQRWQNSGNLNGTISSLQAWESQINALLEYQSNRIEPARNFLDYTLDLNGISDLNLDISPLNSGKINVNTISIDSMPWNGMYFNACELNLTAIADSGYLFSHWTDFEGNTISEDYNLLINVSDQQEFVAHFIKCEELIQVSIYSENSTVHSTINSSTSQFTYQWYLNGIPFSNDSVIIQAKNGNYQLEVISGNCKIFSNQISLQTTVDVSVGEQEREILIYPNPFNNQTIVKFSNPNRENLQINITDISGRILKKINNVLGNEMVIYKENLKAGIYFLELIEPKNKIKAQIVIQ